MVVVFVIATGSGLLVSLILGSFLAAFLGAGGASLASYGQGHLRVGVYREHSDLVRDLPGRSWEIPDPETRGRLQLNGHPERKSRDP
jgi:hypothetical protein